VRLSIGAIVGMLRNPRVQAVIRKEFREFRRTRNILLTMIALPAISLISLTATTVSLPKDAPPGVLHIAVAQVLLFFLLIPMILPTTIASYSIIGERQQGTLEPVLGTPVTDRELLAGKVTAAVVPSILLSWLLFLAYVGIAAMLAPPAVLQGLLSVDQLVAQVALAPALAGLSIVVSVVISLRSSDVRVAQQLSGLAALPILVLVAIISFGKITPSPQLYGGLAAAVVVLDLVGWRFAVGQFSRERLVASVSG
jgi:ABC-type Na+ efflux pump permease subunit